MADFTGQTVLITAASGGLGKTVTRQFLDAGAAVAAVARSWPGEAEQDGRLKRLCADLSDPEGAREAVAGALAVNGRIDVLLHLAGGFAGGEPVWKTEDETWTQMMAVNLNAAFYVFRSVLPHMLEARRGRIIAVGSRTGEQPASGLSAYGVAKAGLHTLVRTVALEVKTQGITVNAVLPSVIDTAANREAMSSADFSKWVQPASIGRLLLWLASEEAGDVSGALIPIYGRA